MSEIYQPGKVEQFAMLRDMTARLGVLHEAQVLQLKLWPHTLIPNLNRFEILVDVQGRALEYHVQFQGRAPAKTKLKAPLAKLEECVRWLLGETWKVRVHHGQKLLWGEAFKLGSNERPDSEN